MKVVHIELCGREVDERVETGKADDITILWDVEAHIVPSCQISTRGQSDRESSNLLRAPGLYNL